jgi:hypothetical protein
MKMSSPFLISARLLPAVKIGESFISLKSRGTNGEGRDCYIYYIDTPEFKYEGDDLKTGCQGGDYQEAMESLLTFLSAAAESWARQMRSREWGEGENADLFPPMVMEWAYQYREEIEMIALELEESGQLIEY